MNTRHPIQPANSTAVLSLGLSATGTRFIAGLSEGCRVFRIDNCLTTYQPGVVSNDIAVDNCTFDVASILDDRYVAFVRGGRTNQRDTHTFVFWDMSLGRQISSFNLHEPILALRLSPRHIAVVLIGRTLLFAYQNIGFEGSDQVGPNKPHSLHSTAANTFGLCILRSDVLVLPAQSVGQVQLIPLPTGSKRVFRAHNTQLRAIALSDDGSTIATASLQGTLIRVFDTKTLDQIAEFRRGVDQAVIYSLAMSSSKRWIACTSDKGTLHIFDLRPGKVQVHEQTSSRPKSISINTSRPIVSTASNSMAKSSPPASVQYQGSVQEYYGLLPPPIPVNPSSQSAATTAYGAFKQSAFAPRALKDTRSIVSISFYLGNETPHWQGGPAFSWTTGPDGSKRRVNNAVLPLPNDPSGRPPKGLLSFVKTDSDEEGATIHVIGGGSDARWERFRLAVNSTGEWVLINEGYRAYLTRQFID